MPAELIDVLRSANKRLAGCLERPPELSCTAAELEALSDSIEQVGRARTGKVPPPDLDPAFAAEFALYTENLRRLKALLEGLQPELEQRRADLHARLTKVRATLGWASTLRQTHQD